MTRSTRNNSGSHTPHSTLFDTGADRSGRYDPQMLPIRRTGDRPRRAVIPRRPTAFIWWCTIGRVVAAVTVTARAVSWFASIFTRGRLMG